MTTTAPAGSPAPPRSRTLRIVLLAVGSVALALLLVLVVGHTVSAFHRVDRSRTSSVAGELDRVSIDTRAADVTVEYADVDRTRIVFDAGDTGLSETHTLSDGELAVELHDSAQGVFGLSIGSARGTTLTVQLPLALDDTGTALDLESTAGEVAVAGSFGDVSLTSTAGDVLVSGSIADLTVETHAGDVVARGLAVSGELRSSSAAGETELDLVAAPSAILVETTAGDQRIRLPDGDYAITTETTIGEVSDSFGSDTASSRRYHFSATMGDIVIEPN